MAYNPDKLSAALSTRPTGELRWPHGAANSLLRRQQQEQHTSRVFPAAAMPLPLRTLPHVVLNTSLTPCLLLPTDAPQSWRRGLCGLPPAWGGSSRSCLLTTPLAASSRMPPCAPASCARSSPAWAQALSRPDRPSAVRPCCRCCPLLLLPAAAPACCGCCCCGCLRLVHAPCCMPNAKRWHCLGRLHQRCWHALLPPHTCSIPPSIHPPIHSPAQRSPPGPLLAHSLYSARPCSPPRPAAQAVPGCPVRPSGQAALLSLVHCFPADRRGAGQAGGRGLLRNHARAGGSCLPGSGTHAIGRLGRAIVVVGGGWRCHWKQQPLRQRVQPAAAGSTAKRHTPCGVQPARRMPRCSARPPARCLQVYKARLRSTGEQVAVKVQRPGIGDSIAVDMVLLRRLVMVVDNNVPQVGGSKAARCVCVGGLRLGHYLGNRQRQHSPPSPSLAGCPPACH